MKEILTPFRVGLVVVAGLAAFIWMYGKIEEGISDDASGYRVYAIFEDVSGLAQKSRVVIAGIGVGEIDKIELAGDKAKVWLRVNTPLKSDARVAKRQASLLGEYYLQLTPGYTGTPLGDGDQIKNVDYDVAPADLMNGMKEIVANVQDITASLKRVVGDEEGEQKLSEILTNINEAVGEVNKAVAANAPKIDVVVDNVVKVTENAKHFTEEFRRDARVILADARKVASDARDVAANVKAIVGENQGKVQEGFDGVRGAVSRLQGALDKLDETLDRARSIAIKIDEGQGTVGQLINDDRLVRNVNELVEESGQFVKKFTRLQTVVAMRSEYYLGQTAVKNYLEVRLQPKPDKYYSLTLVDDPRGRTSFRETVTNSSASDEDPVVREQQTITEDRFRLSLQFAKRFYFVTGRIGIIENTGGLGLDVFLFGDTLELSTDIFAFDENVNPRQRMWGTYTFFTHLYVAAGIDDVWNDELTDFFVGAGIRFTDDDLKAIFTAAPAPSL